MSDNTYLVTCISGQHVLKVIPGTELETKCKEREAKGFVDALCLDYSECPDCVEEDWRRAESEAYYIGFGGCQIGGFGDCECEDDCPCNTSTKITESPYADQVRGLPVTA